MCFFYNIFFLFPIEKCQYHLGRPSLRIAITPYMSTGRVKPYIVCNFLVRRIWNTIGRYIYTLYTKESISTDGWVSYPATCLLTLVINVTRKALNEFGESRGTSCQLGRQSSHSFAPHSCFTSTVKGNVFWQNFRDSFCSCGQSCTLL